MLKSIGLLILLLPAALIAQNPRSASGGEASLWAGGEVSYFNTGYGCAGNWLWDCAKLDQVGVGAFTDFNLTRKFGAEGEARWLHWNGLGGMVESNYVLGPRYRVYGKGPVSFWVKTLFGGGWITTPNYPEVGSLKGSFFMYAPGGSVEYRLTHQIALRAEYEYQIWPSFQAPTTYSGSRAAEHNGPLTPNGVSVGVAWRFLGQ